MLRPADIANSGKALAEAALKNMRLRVPNATLVSWKNAVQDGHPIVFIIKQATFEAFDRKDPMKLYSMLTSWRNKEINFECATPIFGAEYAKNEDARPTSPVQVKNVLDFVNALDNAVAADEPPPGAIRAVYALLSDVCHPAVGGYMLHVAVPQVPGQLKFDAHPNTRMASWFVGSIIAPEASRLMKQMARSLNRLTHVAKTMRAVLR